MIRLLLFIATLAGLTFLGNWLMQHPGNVLIIWLGYEIDLHIAVLAVLLLIIIALTAFLAALFSRLFTWPARRRSRRELRTMKRGLEQLTRGVAALAMGDEDAAEESLKKALAALPGEPLPKLLSAQLQQRQGNYADAQATFRALMHHPVTAELATRKIIEQHAARQEWAEATRLAEEARTTSPRDRWLVLTLIDLHARTNNAAAMLALTEGWQWQSPLTKEERHRMSALAHYIASQNLKPHLREQHLRHAVGYAPGFLPATIDYAYALLADGAPRRARKWLLAAWNEHPSSLLITPILASIADENPRKETRRLNAFLTGEEKLPHALLRAHHAIHARRWEDARSALTDAIDIEETKEVASLMASVERGLHREDAAASWLARALDAPQGPGWVCHSCGSIADKWHTHCASCQSFDTLRYERPEARITSLELARPSDILN